MRVREAVDLLPPDPRQPGPVLVRHWPSLASRLRFAAPRSWEITTSTIAARNTADAITFASAGMPRAAAVYTYFGKVTAAPALKFVMMKSSKLSANDSRAAATMPGSSSGNVIRQNTCDGDA